MQKKYLLKITSQYYFPPGWLQLYINSDIGLIYKVLAVPISFHQSCHYSSRWGLLMMSKQIFMPMKMQPWRVLNKEADTEEGQGGALHTATLSL